MKTEYDRRKEEMQQDTVYTTQGDMFASVFITKNGDGYTSEWWISSKYGINLQLIANVNIPIIGSTLDEARRRVAFSREAMFEMAQSVYGGMGSISKFPDADVRTDIAQYHAEYHLAKFDEEDSRDVRLMALAGLLAQFGVKAYALVISEVMGINVRTVHDIIYRLGKSSSSDGVIY